MANNNLIQILGGRGSFDPSTSNHPLNARQPFYSYFNNQLYIGDIESSMIPLSQLSPIGAANIKPSALINDNKEPGEHNYSSESIRAKNIEKGYQGAVGVDTFAYGRGLTVAGEQAVGFGASNISNNNQTFVSGQNNKALGKQSFATGGNTQVYGDYGFVANSKNINLGIKSTVFGENNFIGGASSLISGEWNTESFFVIDINNKKLYKSWGGVRVTTSTPIAEEHSEIIESTFNENFTPNDRILCKFTLGGKTYYIGYDYYDNIIIGTGTKWSVDTEGNNVKQIVRPETTRCYKYSNDLYLFSITLEDYIPVRNNISGYNNIVRTGENNIVSGARNVLYSGSGNLLTGFSNKITGSFNASFGYNNIVDGQSNIVVGTSNSLTPGSGGNSAGGSGTVGVGLKAVASAQFIVGKYNISSSNIVFAAGIGSGDASRSNAFEILKTGEVKALKIPSSDNEVLRYSDLIPNDSDNVSTSNGFNIKVNTIKAQKVTADNFVGLVSNATADADGNTISSTYLSKTAASNTYATKEQLNALDYSSSGSTTKTITSLSQTNGQISASYSNIAFPVTSVAGRTGSVTLSKSDVGLGNVDNTSDETKKANFTGSISSGNTGFVKGGDVYTELNKKANKATTLSGYGITDAYTKSEVATELNKKANVSDFDKTFEFLTIADGGVLAFKVDADTYTVNNSFTVYKPYYNPVDVAFWKLIVPNGSLTIKSISGTSVGSSVILKNSKNQEFNGTVTSYNGNIGSITYTCKLQ